MWTKSLAALVALVVAVADAADSSAAAESCPLTLSAASKTEWSVACADGSDKTEFDPKLLRAVRIGKYAAVELNPKTAPQPLDVLMPPTLSKVGKLISPTLEALTIQREAIAKVKPVVEFDPKAFTGLTALKKLGVGFFNVTPATGGWDLPPSLNELAINHAGLTDFKTTATNLTMLDLQYNRLTKIPDIVFTSKTLIFTKLFMNDLPPQTMSKRKAARFQQLIDESKILPGNIADFTDECEGGEKQTLGRPNSGLVYLICVVEKEPLDDQIASGSDSESESTGVPSTETKAPSDSTEETPSPTSGSTVTTPAPGSSADAVAKYASAVAVMAALTAQLM